MNAADLEARLLDLARRRGLFTDTSQSGPGPGGLSSESNPRMSSLLRLGRLDPRDLQILVGELMQGPSFTLGGSGEDPDPAAVSWTGYQDLRLIGAGANALVYRAHDPHLNRWVALKFPQASRFVIHLLKEARAQARVDHPHVLKVLEVGEQEGRPFIALQLVEGGSLLETAASFPLETKVRLLKGVAEGLQAAHDQGLLHLDLKPDNILVDTSEPGRPWPYLTDFGQVVPESELAGHRCHGAIPFASPEQLAEDSTHLDRRSDVYALGATLYTVLADRFPFDTLDPDALRTASPIPLRRRDPRLPEDLEAITDKCLRRDPEERYPSARALAEDLQRYLEGRPVRARAATPAYRLGKWTGRNRALAVLAEVTLALLLGIGAWNVHAARGQALRLRQADQNGRDVEGMEQQLRIAHLSRQHDRRPEVAKVRETMARIMHDMATMGREAFGPGAYALGAGHAALGEWDEARSLLNVAWSDGFRTPACAQTRGEVLTRLLTQQKAALHTPDPQERQQDIQKLEAEFREPALACFRVAQRGGLHTPYQEAMIAYLEGDRPRALARAEAANLEAPWHYQADLLRCAILHELGNEAEAAGDDATARQRYSAELEVIGRTLSLAPSDPANWMVQAHAQWDLAQIQDPRIAWIKRCCSSCETAIAVDPDRAEAYVLLTSTMAPLAEDADMHGGNRMAFYDRGVASAELARQRTPIGKPNAALAEALLWRANGTFDLGQDPRPDLDRAITLLKTEISQLGVTVDNCFNLRILYQAKSEAAFAYGEDPIPYSREALHWAEELIHFKVYGLRAQWPLISQRLFLAGFERSLGRPFSEPPANLTLSIRTMFGQRPKGIGPTAQDHGLLGDARLLEAEQKRREGKDPRPDFEAGLDSIQTALRMLQGTPRAAFALQRMAFGCMHYGAFLWAAGENPQPVLTRGLAAAHTSRRLDPGHAFSTYYPMILSAFLTASQGRTQEANATLAKLRVIQRGSPREAKSIQALLDLWKPQAAAPRPAAAD